MKDKDLINFGFINIDKSAGPTSFSVSHFICKKLGLKKTSHLGTLDPKVTGILPIALGRACRLTGFLISHDKTYVGILHTHKEQDIKQLQKLINKNFTGKIKQTPPHKSAVKRAERIREVFYWKLTEADESKKDFLFECKVEGGTYIRKLCSDLGEMIGGAHMDELRRIQAGVFNEEKLYTLYDLEEAIKNNKLNDIIIPAEKIIKEIMPSVQVEKRVIKALLNGKPLFKKDIKDFEKIKKLKTNEVFAVFSGKQFIEIAKRNTGKDIIGRAEFVFA